MPTPPALTWSSIGDTIGFHGRPAGSADLRTLYAVRIEGGVMRSADAGATWTRCAPADATLARGGNEIYCSEDGKVALLRCNMDPLVRSEDGGATWRVTATPTSGSTIASTSCTHALTWNWGGPVRISADGGNTWPRELAVRWANGVALSHDGRVAVVACHSEYVHVSTDSGATWRRVDEIGARAWQGAWVSRDGQHIWLPAPAESCAWVSVNSGASWERRAVGFTISLITGSGDGARLIASDNTRELHISHDGGRTWVAQGLASRSLYWVALQVSDSGDALLASGMVPNDFRFVLLRGQFEVAVTATVTGATVEDGVLTAAHDARDVLRTAYAWQRSDAAGDGWTDIAGATESTYTCHDADVGLQAAPTADGVLVSYVCGAAAPNGIVRISVTADVVAE